MSFNVQGWSKCFSHDCWKPKTAAKDDWGDYHRVGGMNFPTAKTAERIDHAGLNKETRTPGNMREDEGLGQSIRDDRDMSW